MTKSQACGILDKQSYQEFLGLQKDWLEQNIWWLIQNFILNEYNAAKARQIWTFLKPTFLATDTILESGVILLSYWGSNIKGAKIKCFANSNIFL